MIRTHRNISQVAVIVLLFYLQSTYEASGLKTALCPKGFNVAYDIGKSPICYLMKGPETFADKNANCTGNLFTFQLLQSLNIQPSAQSIWTDYKNMYEGGPFVDWSYTKSTGNLLQSTYEVNRTSWYVDEELCVVIDPVMNFTAVRCDEMHHRYCFVPVYADPEAMSDEGCDSMQNFDPDGDYTESEELERATYRFWSPAATCLMKVILKKGRMRSTWDESHGACKQRGGLLLYRGWRYTNYPVFSNSNTYPLFYETIAESEWQFGRNISNTEGLGAVVGNSWALVNSSYRFSDVICEKTIALRNVILNISIDSGGNMVLTVDDKSLKQKNIYCFTDSTSYYPQRVNIKQRRGTKGDFILQNISDGYYWCIHNNLKSFIASESNRVLYIRVKNDTLNLYAVKLTSLTYNYNLTNIGQIVQNNWKNMIEEYVSYSNSYVKAFGYLDAYDNQTIWSYRKNNPGLDVKSAGVVIRQIYLNSRSVLLHVKLYPNMMPLKPGIWDNIQIDYMHPVYFCEQKDPLPDRLALGESKRASVCTIYKCIGNFSEGVQIIEVLEDSCYTPKNISTSVSVDNLNTTTNKLSKGTTRHQKLQQAINSSVSSEEAATDSLPTTSTRPPDITYSPSTTESVTTSTEFTTLPSNYGTYDISPPTTSTVPLPVTTVEPTFPTTTSTPELSTNPQPPKQQIQQVMDDLTTLINNTETVLLADIQSAFTQVDGFLAERDDLEIPGSLLHLLDELGSRIELNGTDEAATVRENVAFLVADAQPSAPVRGLKIAARDSDMFNESAFSIIRDYINSTHLMADANEVVVQLPESLATTRRRISFVVFRNDRAFRSSHGLYSVNSRVLSVNIENTTEFEGEEVIDIYLTPLTEDLERNQSRACAYWKFLNDGSGLGYWSQDGCTFIRGNNDYMLDRCRCDHLTHFAEVLIPRSVFHERDEIALEVISIAGCCLSIFGLIWVGVTALMFRSWRRDYSNKVWLQLCISIFIMSIAFLVILFAHFEEYDVICMLTGIVLHFSVLSSYCWMLVAAVLSYRRLVTVFTIDASHKLLRASAFAWGVPCAVVGILLSVAPHSYSGRFDDKNPTTAFCYPSGLARWLSVFAPIVLMLLVNWTLFALIVHSVFASRRNHPHRQVGNRHSKERSEALRCASVSFFLVFLFGLPWVFGLFAMNIVMAYFFVILSTFQGFVLFLFFVLGNQKTRDLWLNKLKIKQTRKIPVTTSSYANNRSGDANVNVNRLGKQVETLETKISKPRSLTSLDESRFS